MTEAADSTGLMRRALRLARRGLGRVEPNPMVGCVLTRQGQVLGEGFHGRFAGPHAETEALAHCRQGGGDPAGADVYVTLEPCNHEGKTPPCTDALLAAGVRRVFIAMADPNSEVAGGGIGRLRGAGVEVQVGLCQDEARQLNEAYVKRVTTGLPWTTLKWAQTLDGRIATASGDSRWISNPASRRLVHRLRARVDAVMVGVGTVLADDPLLTARQTPVRRVARRVVVDPALRTPMGSQLVQSLGGRKPAAPLTIAVGRDVMTGRPQKLLELEQLGVEFVALEAESDDPRRLALRTLLAHLSQHHGATNVLVEGGATLAGHLVGQGLVDQVIAFVAPALSGDAAAMAAVTGLTCARVADVHKLVLRAVKRVGDDVMLDYRVVATA